MTSFCASRVGDANASIALPPKPRNPRNPKERRAWHLTFKAGSGWGPHHTVLYFCQSVAWFIITGWENKKKFIPGRRKSFAQNTPLIIYQLSMSWTHFILFKNLSLVAYNLLLLSLLSLLLLLKYFSTKNKYKY